MTKKKLPTPNSRRRIRRMKSCRLIDSFLMVWLNLLLVVLLSTILPFDCGGPTTSSFIDAYMTVRSSSTIFHPLRSRRRYHLHRDPSRLRSTDFVLQVSTAGGRSHRYHESGQQWKLADQIDDPSDLPDWATSKEGLIKLLHELNLVESVSSSTPQSFNSMECLETSPTTTNGSVIIVPQILTRESPTYDILNDTPFWTEFCAQIVNMATTLSSTTTMDASSNHNPSRKLYQQYQQDEQEPNLKNSFLTVSPVSGYIAPKGGTTNLCNENERYQDFCQFRIIYPSDSTTMVSPFDAVNDSSSTTASTSATSENATVYYHDHNKHYHQFLVIETEDKKWIVKIEI